MALTGQEFRQIQAVLLDAYPTAQPLREMVRFELNENLDRIAGGSDQGERVYNLIEWADRVGRIRDLIQGAYDSVPGNVSVRSLHEQWFPPTSSTPESLDETHTPSHLFLSYSRSDTLFKERLAVDLSAAGFTVWTDDNLEPGTLRWQRTIQQALRNAVAMVVVLTPNAEASEWVNREIVYAQTLGRRIFPILAAGDEKSAVPINLIDTQWADAQTGYAEAVQGKLIPSLQRYLQTVGNAPAEAGITAEVAADPLDPPTDVTGGRPQRRGVILGLAVGALALLLGIVLWRVGVLGGPGQIAPLTSTVTDTATEAVADPSETAAALAVQATTTPAFTVAATAATSPTPTQVPTYTPIAPSIIASTIPADLAAGGRFALAGRGEPGVLVEILLNGAKSGTTLVDGGGYWSYEMEFRESGRHRLGVRALISGVSVLSDDDPIFVLVPTATATETNTPRPTSTATRMATPTPSAGAVREFDGIPFVYVPAGEFTMGSDNAGSDEQPMHKVYLDDYWIMRTEVTNAQYKACVDAGDCRVPDNERWNTPEYAAHPMTDVSWDDAVAFGQWLTAQSGYHIRLPTEAEWEKAARGADGRTYPWGDDQPTDQITNYSHYVGNTTEVGNYPDDVSPYGALDMAGNVREWTTDCYNESYYAESPERNPVGPDCADSRVVRGGSWGYFASSARTADRLQFTPDYRNGDVGFRLAFPGF